MGSKAFSRLGPELSDLDLISWTLSTTFLFGMSIALKMRIYFQVRMVASCICHDKRNFGPVDQKVGQHPRAPLPGYEMQSCFCCIECS